MTETNIQSVLIVEDERIVARDLERTLIELGYAVVGNVSSGKAAIAKASERCPDIVLMDIHIEGDVDGIQTAEVLRARFDVPVVFLTAYGDDATIARAKRTEPHGYLVKPIRIVDLRGALEISVYRHRMEKSLHERERWYATTLESIADAVVSVDLGGNVIFMNPVAETLTGTRAADALGRPAREILQLSSAELEISGNTPLEQALRDNCAVQLQESGLLNLTTGARHMITDSAAPVISDGTAIGAVMVFRDVTDQRRMQKQLELSNHLASLGTMAAGVAHEVNNPLAVVTANAEIVERKLADMKMQLQGQRSAIESLEEMAQALADVREAGSRIAKIVTDLRAFSRPSRAPHTSISGAADVRSCIEWAARTTAHELKGRAKLSLRVREDLPFVNADETRLGQVLVNLIVNAAHAISPGAVADNDVIVTADLDARSWVVMAVSDTGCGIALVDQPKIFDPFFTTKEPQAGTGLGLSICHGIVSALGGELTFSSTPGVGSLFSVALPPSTAADCAQLAPAHSARKTVLTGRLLLVDDEVMVLRFLARALCAHELVHATSAQDALKILDEEKPFDLILCDLAMAQMTGADFYEAVLARDPGLSHRIVFMSGGAITQGLTDFLKAVPNARLEKPFALSKLDDEVQRLLARPVPKHGWWKQ